MAELLDHLQTIRNPVILAGDLNTSGRNDTPTSLRREMWKRFGNHGWWLQQGLKSLTGLGLALDVVLGGLGLQRTHADPTVAHLAPLFPNPERQLFDDIEHLRFADGFVFDFRGEPGRSANQLGGTLANSNQRSLKGFQSTYDLERTYGPLGRFKLDWIFVKSHLQKPRDRSGSYRFAPHFARTLRALNYSLPERLSDHSPLIVDLPFLEPSP